MGDNSPDKKKNLHAGHRKRMREDFSFSGFSDWHEHKVMEFMLQQVIPRGDTNEIAHRLVNSCGGFAEVFRASKDKLVNIAGVGDKTADYIHVLGEFVKYYNGVRYDVNRLSLEGENGKGYFLNLFDGMDRENFFMICLDSQMRIILKKHMHEGNFESMEIDISGIVRTAVKSDATYVILAHNHPSGIAKASDADIAATKTISRALAMAGVKLLDHILVAKGQMVRILQDYPQKY